MAYVIACRHERLPPVMPLAYTLLQLLVEHPDGLHVDAAHITYNAGGQTNQLSQHFGYMVRVGLATVADGVFRCATSYAATGVTSPCDNPNDVDAAIVKIALYNRELVFTVRSLLDNIPVPRRFAAIRILLLYNRVAPDIVCMHPASVAVLRAIDISRVKTLMVPGNDHGISLVNYTCKFDHPEPAVCSVLYPLCAQYNIDRPFFVNTHENVQHGVRSSNLPGLYRFTPAGHEPVTVHVTVPSDRGTQSFTISPEAWQRDMLGELHGISGLVHRNRHPFLTGFQHPHIKTLRDLQTQCALLPEYTPLRARVEGTRSAVNTTADDFCSQFV